MNKKKLKILITLILTIITIVLVVLIMNRDTEEPAPTDPGGSATGFPISGNNPDSGSGLGTGGTGTTDTPVDPTVLPKLFKITDGPVAGAVSFMDGGNIHVRYIERAKGHAYDVTINPNLDQERVSANTIPKVQRAHWNNTGDHVILQYLADNSLGEEIIRSHSISLAATTSVSNSFFLPDNSLELTVSPDGTQVAYLLETVEGAHVVTSPMDTNTPQQVFYSPLKEWLIDWESDTIHITTKPSYEIPGYSYVTPTDDDTAQKTLSGVLGLTTNVQPNGGNILYSKSDREGTKLYTYDLGTAESDIIPFKTLSEKCTWSDTLPVLYCSVSKYLTEKGLPDSWYKGQTSFNDKIWVYNIGTRKSGLIVDPELFSGVIADAVDLFLSPDETHLFFTNKIDGSLWGVNLLLES